MSSPPAGCALGEAAAGRLGELPRICPRRRGSPRHSPGSRGGLWGLARTHQQIRCSLRADEGDRHQPSQEMVTTTCCPGPVSARAHDPCPLSGPRTRAGGNVVGATGSRCHWGSCSPVPHSRLCIHHGFGVPFHPPWVPNHPSRPTASLPVALAQPLTLRPTGTALSPLSPALPSPHSPGSCSAPSPPGVPARADCYSGCIPPSQASGFLKKPNRVGFSHLPPLRAAESPPRRRAAQPGAAADLSRCGQHP